MNPVGEMTMTQASKNPKMTIPGAMMTTTPSVKAQAVVAIEAEAVEEAATETTEVAVAIEAALNAVKQAISQENVQMKTPMTEEAVIEEVVEVIELASNEEKLDILQENATKKTLDTEVEEAEEEEDLEVEDMEIGMIEMKVALEITKEVLGELKRVKEAVIGEVDNKIIMLEEALGDRVRIKEELEVLGEMMEIKELIVLGVIMIIKELIVLGEIMIIRMEEAPGERVSIRKRQETLLVGELKLISTKDNLYLIV